MYNNYYYDSYATTAATGILTSMIIGFLVVFAVVAVVLIISNWKIFNKAGKPGWASIVPIYNNIVMLEIVDLEWWHILIMMFVPFAAIVYSIIISIKLAEKFEKPTSFAVLLILLPIIGYPMLAFGSAEYQA